MARIDWVEDRLRNWASWKLASGGEGEMGYSAVNLADADAGRSGYVTSAVPILAAEASATDDAVQRLNPLGLRLTVWEVYCGPGGLADKASRLCCAVSTVHSRIDQAHLQIAEHLRQRRTARDAERVRVEQALQYSRGRRTFTG